MAGQNPACPMTPPHLNPGRSITIPLETETVVGFSISALATYLLIPELGTAFDMGECPLEAVPLDRVFISHAHGDHARCLLRHESLRRLMSMEPATYYIPAQTLDGFLGLAQAWRALEGHRNIHLNPPRFHPMQPGDVAWLHRQLAVKAFEVTHSQPSLGYTLYDVRKKLKPEYQGWDGAKLAQLRREGVAFEEETWLPRITYVGDSTIETLYRETHIWKSNTLFLEVTFLLPDERKTARERGHTHLDDLLDFLKDHPDALENRHIILKHFSMRYDKRFILKTLKNRLPQEFQKRVHILL